LLFRLQIILSGLILCLLSPLRRQFHPTALLDGVEPLILFGGGEGTVVCPISTALVAAIWPVETEAMAPSFETKERTLMISESLLVDIHTHDAL
jgi:hypothetical protein